MPVAPTELVDRRDALAAAEGFSEVVHVSGPGVPQIARAYGWADRSSRRAMTARTRLAIASGTKTFTALAVLTLPVPVDDLVDRQDWLPVLAGHPTVAAPGATFACNNGGYVVSALVAQRSAGRRYHDQVADVCAAAGMTDTHFHRNDAPGPDFATGHLGDGRTNATLMPRHGCGDCGLSTTVADVDRFWAALGDGLLVSPDMLTAMTTAPSTDPGSGLRYGLGVWLPPDGPI